MSYLSADVVTVPRFTSCLCVRPDRTGHTDVLGVTSVPSSPYTHTNPTLTSPLIPTSPIVHPSLHSRQASLVVHSVCLLTFLSFHLPRRLVSRVSVYTPNKNLPTPTYSVRTPELIRSPVGDSVSTSETGSSDRRRPREYWKILG